MKKRVVKLVILLLVIAILAVAYILVNNISPEGNTEATTGAVQTHTVASLDLNTVYQFGYKYKGTEYAFRLSENQENWTWDGDDTLPISNLKVAYMLTYFSSMTSTIKIDSLDEVKRTEYGFDSPTLEIYFKDLDGTHSYTVGITNTYNSLTYITSEGSDSAYMVASDFVDEFSCEIIDMLEIEGPGTLSLSEKISINVEKENTKLVYSYYPTGKSSYISNNCNWFVSVNENEEFPINEETGKNISSALKSALFAKVVSFEDGAQEKYGLADKNIKIELTGTNVITETDSETGEEIETKTPCNFIFYLGDSDEDGFSYACAETKLVYLTTSDIFGEICNIDINNLASIYSAYVWNADSDTLDEINISYGEKEHIFKINENATQKSITLNGIEIDVEKANTFIKRLASISWDNDTSKAKKTVENPQNILSIEIKSGDISASAVFKEYSDEYYQITFNERNEFLILKSNLGEIITLLSEF